MALCRFAHEQSDRLQWGWIRGNQATPVEDERVLSVFTDRGSLIDLGDTQGESYPASLVAAPLLDDQEIWAAGVTYESSKLARMAESTEGGDFYARVYTADRPELFLKATPSRVSGPNEPLCIRSDSTWNVPEPELAVVASAHGVILGYTIGNDMSSRDIEGANPLYLPQAKVYRRSCGLGPWIVPAESVDPAKLTIHLNIERAGATAFEGETSTARMRRSPQELVDWLFRHNDFLSGVVLLTGTGIIPPDEFTLQPEDVVTITIEGIGSLTNPVEVSAA